jgi:hypothetical protein
MIGLLHTARGHVATFDRLARELDAGIVLRHEVRESLLAEAIAAGSAAGAVETATREAVRDLVSAGALVIVCTCSTIGAVAELTPVPEGVLVMRIDRPMAEQAVASGRRIVVAAALPSTFEPTLALLEQIAAAQGRAIEVAQVHCKAAWPLFETGDRARYALEIARSLEASAGPSDLILLAQASMAPAAELLGHLGIPVLSSPALGLEAAVAKYHALHSHRIEPA